MEASLGLHICISEVVRWIKVPAKSFDNLRYIPGGKRESALKVALWFWHVHHGTPVCACAHI